LFLKFSMSLCSLEDGKKSLDYEIKGGLLVKAGIYLTLSSLLKTEGVEEDSEGKS